MQIEQLVIGRRRVDLEVAGVDDHADRRRNGHRDATHNRVRYMDELDFKRTDLDDVFGFDGVKVRLLLDFILLQTPLDERQSEGGSVDRNVELGEEKGHRADMVFMAMGRDDAEEILLGRDRAIQRRT